MSKELWRDYWQLMRFDKPVGIALLWYPVSWALWLGAQGTPPIQLLIIFFIGTVVMRAAGCVINDIADRDFDRFVERTTTRPLTSGRLSLYQAILCLTVLLVFALILLCLLPYACIPWAMLAVVITGIYPFCKRFFATPQLILGIAFSMAIPMVYAALGQPIMPTGVLLVMLNIAWVVAYDTEYAMVDRADDLKIGIQSTAVFFASRDRLMIMCLMFITQGIWLIVALLYHMNLFFYTFLILSTINLFYQFYLIKDRTPTLCFQAFLQNTVYGLLLWLGLILHYFFK